MPDRSKSRVSSAAERTSGERAQQGAASSFEQLDLIELNAVLATVDTYPVTSGTLAKEAKRLHSAMSVVNFFESIPDDTAFTDKADVIRRSVEVEMLREDEQNEPEEKLRDYEE